MSLGAADVPARPVLPSVRGPDVDLTDLHVFEQGNAWALAATRDVELPGLTVRAGDKVVAWFAAANRDERVYDERYRFDVLRAASITWGWVGARDTSAWVTSWRGSSCGS
jgi:hypothetical protein